MASTNRVNAFRPAENAGGISSTLEKYYYIAGFYTRSHLHHYWEMPASAPISSPAFYHNKYIVSKPGNINFSNYT
jgi:hypothetical protein